MRIVIVDTTIQGPLIGGAQTFLPHLITGLAKKRHEVHLVTGGEPDERVRPALANSGAVIHDAIWGNKAVEQDAARVLASWINKLRPDLYLVSVSPDIGWLAIPVIDPSIATMAIGHTDSETFYNPARHYQSFLTKVVGVSEQVRKQYIETCHIAADDTRWIPYGVINNTVPPVEETSGLMKLVYVGRLEEEQKRVSDLVTIIQQLAAKGLSFHFSIIGDGPERGRMETGLAKELSGGTVTFHGWQSSPEVIRILRESSVFILTSAYEGFCIALVEAMANGCCPLVTNIQSGNEQLIQHEKSGFIFPVGDTAAFVSQLMLLEKDRARLQDLRTHAWENGKNFSIEKMVEGYEAFFLEAIREARNNQRETDPGFPPMPGCQSPYPLWVRRLKKQLFH